MTTPCRIESIRNDNAILIFSGYFSPLIAIFCGASIGLLLNVNSVYIFLLFALLPIIWLRFSNRWIAALFILSYYLVSSWEVIPDFYHYEYGQWLPLLKGAAVWFVMNVVPVIPWVIFFPRKRTTQQILISLFLLLVVLTIPPFGALFPSDPLTAAGLIYPGMSWSGLIFCALFIMSMAVFLYSNHYKKISLLLCAALLCVSAYSQIYSIQSKKIPQNWAAITTDANLVGFNSYLIHLVKEQINKDKKVIILPENSIDIRSLNKPKWKSLIQLLSVKKATLIAGSYEISPSALTLRQGFDAKHREGFVIIYDGKIQFYNSHQPLPIISWLPVGYGNVKAYWHERNVYDVGGTKVGIFICYEDFLPWMIVMAMRDDPEVLISVANHWWNQPTATQKQSLIFQLWGRLMGVPVLMADNLKNLCLSCGLKN